MRSDPFGNRSGIWTAAALLLLVLSPLLFRAPAVIIWREELFTDLVAKLVQSEPVREDWTASELEELLSEIYPVQASLPSALNRSLAAGRQQFYPTEIFYAYEPGSSSILIVASLTGQLDRRENRTLSGEYTFTSERIEDISFYLLEKDADSGWPQEAYRKLTSAF